MIPTVQITPGGLRPVLETALDAVVVMEADGSVRDWNAAAEATLGWSRADAVGRLLADLVIPHAFRELHARGLAHYLTTGEGPVLRKRIEVTALHRSGREFPIELSITPTEDAGRTVFLGFLRDISERRRSEQLVERQLRDATLLSRVTSLAAKTGSLDEALSASLEAICEVTGWPLGHAFVVSAANPVELCSTPIWRGSPPDSFRKLTENTARTEFSRGVGLPGKVLESGAPVWISDLKGDPGFIRAQGSDDLGVRSAFAFPVQSSGRTAAVLEFFSDRTSKPDAELILTVQTLGEQVGRVFERISSESQLRAEKASLELEVIERKRIAAPRLVAGRAESSRQEYADSGHGHSVSDSAGKLLSPGLHGEFHGSPVVHGPHLHSAHRGELGDDPTRPSRRRIAGAHLAPGDTRLELNPL